MSWPAACWCVALLVSPILTVFLASLGILVWLTARVHGPRCPAGVRRGDARRLGAALPAARRPGLLRTVRVYGVGGVRPPAIRRASGAVPAGRQPADHHQQPLNPEHGPALRSRAGDRAGAAGLQRGRQRADLDRRRCSSCWSRSTGLAYPITEWLRHAEGDPPGQSLGGAASSSSSSGSPSCIRTSARISSSLSRNRSPSRTSTLESRSGRVLLDDVSVEIPAGARTAMMGCDDDSKLALACLIPRLIDPKSGRVLIDGHDLRDVDPRLDPRPGRHRAPGRPGLHRLGAGRTSAWAIPMNTLPRDHRGRQGGPCPPLHSGPAARLRHDDRASSATTSSPTSSSASRWRGPISTTPRS